jgi:hypothetical protein
MMMMMVIHLLHRIHPNCTTIAAAAASEIEQFRM